MKKPLVSVCCIAYNHEKYIADAIESFISQKTTFPYEIIIHDDASTDNTAKIIKYYSEKYPGLIKAIYQDENQFSKGNNKLLASTIIPYANGEFIATCEGDDFWTDSSKLQKQVEILINDNDVSICFHRVAIVTKRKDITGGYLGLKMNKDGYCSLDKLLINGVVHISSIMTRKNYFEDLGPLPKWYKDATHGDFVFIFFLATCGKAYYMNSIMSDYRIDVENSLMTKIKKNNSKENEISYFIQRILTFQEADKYFNYKFHKVIENINLLSEVRINILKNNYRIKTLKIYLKYIKKEGILAFIKQLLSCKLPKLFNIFVKTKNKCNRLYYG